jgi:hypothetical protein
VTEGADNKGALGGRKMIDLGGVGRHVPMAATYGTCSPPAGWPSLREESWLPPPP